MKNIAKISKKYGKQLLTIVSGGAIAAGLVVGGLLLLAPQEYSSEIRLLVVQKYTLTDTYTAAKSAEKISQNLAAVVHTSSFYDEVVRTQWGNLSDIEALPEEEKRKAWERKLKTGVDTGTSIISFTAYDEDPQNAERIVQSVSTALLEHGANYHGAPDTVSLRVVDEALTSDHPTRPNVLVNGAIAAFAGMLIAAFAVFMHPSTGFRVSKLKTAAIPQPPVPAAPQKKITVELDSAPKKESVADQKGKVHVEEVHVQPEKIEYAVLDVTNFTSHIAKHAVWKSSTVEERVQSMPFTGFQSGQTA